MLKRIVIAIGIAAMLVPATGTAAPVEILLTVDDGDFFYDGDGDCVGDTDDPAAGVATRHWHVGIPFVPVEAEAAGGFGCLGGPKSWDVTIADGWSGLVTGSIRYTWDQDVPGGCCNDVQLHVFSGEQLTHSTMLTQGPQPIIPQVLPILEHTFSFTLPPGSYTISEDVFSGEHTAWLTKLEVTRQIPAPY